MYGGQHAGSSDCSLLGDSFEDSTALAILEDAPGLAQHLLPIPEKPKRQMAGGVAILLPSPSGIQRIFSALARLALLAVKTGLNRPRILSEQSPLTAKVRFFSPATPPVSGRLAKCKTHAANKSLSSELEVELSVSVSEPAASLAATADASPDTCRRRSRAAFEIWLDLNFANGKVAEGNRHSITSAGREEGNAGENVRPNT